MHLAVSNLYQRYNKEFNKEFYSVNTKKFNLIQQMRDKYLSQNRYEKINISFAQNLKDYGYIYKNPANRLYMTELRGFEADKLIDFSIQNSSKKLKD